MELELKEIRERSFLFYLLIAILIHLVVGFGAYHFLKTSAGQKISGLPEFTNGGFDAIGTYQQDDPEQMPVDDSEDHEPLDSPHDDEPVTDTLEPQPPVDITEIDEIPPFEKSLINQQILNESTFLHKRSGLLFADEIAIPGIDTSTITRRKIISPQINREFNLSNIPQEFRDRQWNITLRVRVDENGYPVGRIRVIRSSGNAVLDQIIISRVESSTFTPAHYEGTDNYIDYTYDLEINIK